MRSCLRSICGRSYEAATPGTDSMWPTGKLTEVWSDLGFLPLKGRTLEIIGDQALPMYFPNSAIKISPTT